MSQKISETTAAPKPRRATLKDVADAVGVSVNAASVVLNDRSGNVRVSPATRRAIIAAARKLNYRRNVAASTLAGGRTRTLGILMPHLSNAYSAPVVEAFEREVSTLGYQCFVGCTQYDGLRKIEYVERFLGYGVDGLLVSTIWSDPEVRSALQTALDQKLPMVFVDYTWDEFPMSLVCGNHRQGGQLIARHLLEMGHRHLLFAAHNSEFQVSSVQSRMSGLRDVVQEAGLPEDAVSVFGLGSDGTEFEVDGLLRAMKDKPELTVIVTPNDVCALMLAGKLSDHGVRVPDDIAITGYDDILSPVMRSFGVMDQIPRLVSNNLTTVRQPLADIGRKAGKVLVDLIENGDGGRVETHLLNVELVARASSQLPVRAR